MLVGQSGGTVALVIGRTRGAWDVKLSIFAEAATTFTLPLGGSAIGVGDVNGDGRADFAVASGSQVRLYAGSATFVRNGLITLPSPIATFASSDANPKLAPLGDINGDGLTDFGFSSGGNAQFVLGRSSGGVGRNYGLPTTNGFIAGLGDVNADGRADFALTSLDAFLVSRVVHLSRCGGRNHARLAATIDPRGQRGRRPVGRGRRLELRCLIGLVGVANRRASQPSPSATTSQALNSSAISNAPLAPLFQTNLLTTSFGFAGNGLLGLIGATATTSNVVVDDDYCTRLQQRWPGLQQHRL